MFRLSCETLGFHGCPFVAQADTWDDTVAASKLHAAQAHKHLSWPHDAVSSSLLSLLHEESSEEYPT